MYIYASQIAKLKNNNKNIWCLFPFYIFSESCYRICSDSTNLFVETILPSYLFNYLFVYLLIYLYI